MHAQSCVILDGSSEAVHDHALLRRGSQQLEATEIDIRLQRKVAVCWQYR
jgi:hypothetical protein